MSDHAGGIPAGLSNAPGKAHNYGCFHCMAGKEESALQQLNRLSDGVVGNVPTKLRYRRSAGQAVEESVILFPGYVFVRVDGDIEADDFRDMARRVSNARLLTDMDGKWPLQAADAMIAKTFFDQQGAIGFSRAYYEGDRIRVVEGFLKAYEGRITRVNHRARTAEITLVIQDKVFKAWLGFELIEKG